jgi:hypothetical protein
MAREPVLRPEEVASVLGDIGGAMPSADATALAWSMRRPVVIAPDVEPAARKRLEELARALGEALGFELDAEVGIEVQGFQQEQAGVAFDTLPKPAWVLSFLCKESGGVSLALDPTCALALLELALGGAGNTAASVRQPTPLESRVLSNLWSALTVPYGVRCAIAFAAGRFDVGRLPERLAMSGETLGVGLLRMKIADNEHTALMLASPTLLRIDPTHAKPIGARRGALAARLARVRVAARPVLRGGVLPLADLLALQPGDVLTLKPPADADLELRIAEHTPLLGRIARQGTEAHFRVRWRRGVPTHRSKETT